jgi:hypothetical protein
MQVGRRLRILSPFEFVTENALQYELFDESMQKPTFPNENPFEGAEENPS